MLLLEGRYSTDTTAGDNAETIGLRVRCVAVVVTGVLHRLSRCRQCELGETIGSLRFLPFHVQRRVKVFHLAGKPHGEIRGVERTYGVAPAHA